MLYHPEQILQQAGIAEGSPEFFERTVRIFLESLLINKVELFLTFYSFTAFTQLAVFPAIGKENDHAQRQPNGQPFPTFNWQPHH